MLRKACLALVVFFAGAQFIRPDKSNPPADSARTAQAHTQMSPEVAVIFERACRDCHSNDTRWPLYSTVAPVSWFVANHVKHGRRHLNFSDWSEVKEPERRLEKICEEVESGQMPLKSYTLIHRNALLSDKDVQVVCAWTRAETERLASQR